MPHFEHMQHPLGAVGRVAKVSLRVRDLDTSTEFYTDVIGCTVADNEKTSDRRRHLALSTAPENTGDEIELIAGRPIGAVSALDHFSVEVPSTELVNSIYQRAVDAHFRVAPPRESHDLCTCVLFDPDGHKIEVFARLS